MRTRAAIAAGMATIVLTAFLGLGHPAAAASSASREATGLRWQLPEGRSVVPLRAARPDWLTPELLDRARQGPTAAPAAAAPDVPASGFVGIRPGSFEVDPYGCTMNFVFRKGGSFAIGTAGHCVDSVGQHVTLLTVAPGGGHPVLVDIGTVILRAFKENRIAPDFALVAVRPELSDWVFPTIAQVGGPCGVYGENGLAQVGLPTIFRGQDPELGPEVVSHYGHGLGVGTGGTARSGPALYWDDPAYYFDSAAAFGDSGSPVRVSGLDAAGNLTTLVVDLRRPGAFIAGTRMTAISDLVGDWSLVESPYCP